MKVTVDTNVLVRLATRDDVAQADTARKTLRKATLIAVPTIAVCEMVWVLLRGYRYSAEQVAHAVRALLSIDVVVCDTPALHAGLALLDAGGDFADGALAFEGARLGGTQFLSFDQNAVKLLKAQGRTAKLIV